MSFISKVLMPRFGVLRIYLARSDSTAKWPDIWVEKNRIPVITVTKEWSRQNVHERRKRLVHEFLHLTGMEHNEEIGYSTYPDRDSFSKRVYEGLMGLK